MQGNTIILHHKNTIMTNTLFYTHTLKLSVGFRKQLIAFLFEKSQHIYTKYFKKQAPWQVTKQDLLRYPEGSIGKHLGLFLNSNNYELIPKVERHDAYHIVTGYGTTVEDEIALQYLCYANGKRSLYLYGVLLLGTCILPEYIAYYYHSYGIGKRANAFHHFNYEKLLNTSLKTFRAVIFSNSYLELINSKI